MLNIFSLYFRATLKDAAFTYEGQTSGLVTLTDDDFVSKLYVICMLTVCYLFEKDRISTRNNV